MRPHNSQECSYGGYKLSNNIFDVDVSESVVAVSIGCDEDDTFYSKCDNSGRVQIFVETEDHDGRNRMVNVDLEDVLRAAKRLCGGIFKRVAEENEEQG